MNEKRPTLREVADTVGLHVSTVSRALSGGGRMAEATRERVRSAAREMGYVPDPMLQALCGYRERGRNRGHRGTLAWLPSPDDGTRGYGGRARQFRIWARAAAERFGYALDDFPADSGTFRRLPRIWAARGILGALLPPQLDPDTRIDLDFSAVSVVRVGDSVVAPRCNVVAPDQYGNMIRLVDALRERGCRRIGFWLPRRVDERTRGRHSAGFWRAGGDAAGHDWIPPRLADGYDVSDFLAWVRRHRPDAVIGPVGALSAWLAEAGRPAPVLAGFGDTTAGLDEVGEGLDEDWPGIFHAAVRLLDSQIRHRERGVPDRPRHILIEGQPVPPICTAFRTGGIPFSGCPTPARPS